MSSSKTNQYTLHEQFFFINLPKLSSEKTPECRFFSLEIVDPGACDWPRAFAFRGAKIYNNLSKHITDMESLSVFKKRLFKNLFNSYIFYYRNFLSLFYHPNVNSFRNYYYFYFNVWRKSSKGELYNKVCMYYLISCIQTLIQKTCELNR